jgi:hypothetical protein
VLGVDLTDPLVNLARLQTRAGRGEAAWDLLVRLNHAARKREKTEIDGRTVDLSALTRTDEDHRQVCQELWVALLVDGARALARIGRWTDAAQTMAHHRGIGNRLLDGRQIKIMALLEQGRDQEARDLIDTTQATESWEHAIGLLLHAHCLPDGDPLPHLMRQRTLCEVAVLLAQPEPSTAVFQTRAGLAALDLDPRGSGSAPLLDAVCDVARLDACAARDVLHDSTAAPALSSDQERALTAVIAAAGLEAGDLSAHHSRSLTSAVAHAERTLAGLLHAPG